MDTGERLAAYLAGDLDTDDARALERELAREPSLRVRLARMRRLEDELAGLPPVELPAGFSEELRATVQRELDARPVAGDELAERRARQRRTPTWLPLAAGAAAALAAIVGIGTSLTGLGGDDTGADGPETMALDAAEEEAAGGTAEAQADLVDGPVVVAAGRAYDATEIEALAGDERFAGIVAQGLTPDQAAETAQRYADTLTAPAGADDAPVESGPADGEQDTGDAALSPGGPELQVRGDQLTESDLAAVSGCLEQLLVDQPTVIPAYAELASFEGNEAIVYGLVSRDPATEAFTRVELWVVDRDTCEVVFFSQQDR